MNQEAIDRLPEHLKSVVDTMPNELKEALFLDVEIDWNFINSLRDNLVRYWRLIMNQEAIDRLPEHLKSVVDTMPNELKAALFPDVEIDWHYINIIRDKVISLALLYSPYIFQKKLLDELLWSIQEFIDALMQEQEFDDIYYEYDALTDYYTIYYIKTEVDNE